MTEIKLPSHWKVIKLGSIAKLSSGGTPSRTKPEYWNGNIPWIKTGEINYGIITDAEEKITQEGLNNSSAKIIPADTLLMAMYGQGITRGRVAILGIDAAINQACSAIFINNDIVITEFLFYFLYYSYEKIRNLGHGANQKNLNSALIKSIEVYLPFIHEQKEIANTLQTIQKAKETRKRELELEQERKAAFMQYIFTHGTRNEPREQKEIGKIPKSWNIVRFKNIIVSGTQNGIYKSKEFYGQGYRIADMKDIFKGEVLASENMDRLDLDDEEFSKFSLNESDLIFARRSFKPEGAGKCQFVPKLDEPVVFSSSIIRVSLKKEIIEPRFYAYFFNSEIGNKLMRQITRILAVSGISGSDLKNLPVPFLCIEEQKEVIATLEACDRKISALEKEIAILDELFHAMLEQLMTGKISTQALSEIYV